MEFRNLTPFPAIAFDALDQRDVRFHTVAIRLTFTLQPDGTLAFAEEQTPLITSDVHYGEPNQSSSRQESDFVPYKPCTDVIINAHAHAPMGKVLEQFYTGIEIQSASITPDFPSRPHGLNQFDAPSAAQLASWAKQCDAARLMARAHAVILSKNLLVSGPREWRRRSTLLRVLSAFALPKWRLSRATPIAALPLRYEYAYGGENKVLSNAPHARRVPRQNRLSTSPSVPKAPPATVAIAHSVHVGNPIGIGWIDAWFAKAARCKRVSAPQIIHPAEQLTPPGTLNILQPAGFGIVSRAWQPRLAMAGTYDQAWLEKRHPYLPADFNFRYWNGAPEDQQVRSFLTGDETVTLFNMCPHTTPGARRDANDNTCLSFHLPGHLPFVLVRYEDGQIAELPAHLDTLLIEAVPVKPALPLAIQVIGVWRATIAVTPAVRILEARMISRNEADAMRTEQQIGTDAPTATVPLATSS